MAKKKISELPAGGALNGTELVPIVQTGTTKRITAQDIANLGNASGVEGSGTINRLAKFTATSTIGNSQLFDDGTSVGLGTITPLGLLHLFKASAATRMVIDGNAGQNKIITYRTNAVQRFGLYVNNTAESGSNVGSDFQIRAYNDAGTLLSTPLFIKRSTGNIGINTTSPAYKLDVNGTGRFTGISTGAYLLLNAPSSGGTITMQADGVSFADIGSELGNFGTGSATNLCVSARSGKDLILGGGALKTLTLASSGAATFASASAGYGLSITNINDSSEGLLVRASDNDGGQYLLNLQSSVGATSQTWVSRFTVDKTGAATFSSSVTAGDSLLINNLSVSKKGYKFQSPSSNWNPQQSGIFFTPADGVNAATTFSVELWDGNGNTTNALSIAPLGAATFSNTITSTKAILNSATPNFTLKYSGTDDWVFGEDAGVASRDFNIYNFNTASINFGISRATGAATFNNQLTINQTAAAQITSERGNSNTQGVAQLQKIVRQYSAVSLGTKLIIPFISQGNLNSTTFVRIIGHSAMFNNNAPQGFSAEFALGHLNALSNLATLNSSGNILSIAINGMNIEITFVFGYGSATASGIYTTIEYMTNNVSFSIDVPNITMN
jgi:hypothetical protein